MVSNTFQPHGAYIGVTLLTNCVPKSGNGAIGYRRKLPSVKITLPGDISN